MGLRVSGLGFRATLRKAESSSRMLGCLFKMRYNGNPKIGNPKNIVGIYLECHGDLVSGLIITITRVIIWVVGVINLLAKSS